MLTTDLEGDDMNKQRRKQLDSISQQVRAAMDNLEEVAADEQDYFDNMPEAIQDSEKGTRAGEIISNLGIVYDELETAMESLDTVEDV